MEYKKYRKGRTIKSIELLTENHKKKIENKTNGEFTMIGSYNDKAIRIKHIECGRISELNPRYFLSKLVCPVCAREKRYQVRLEKTKTIVSKFKNDLKIKVGEEYTVTRDYMDPDERKVSLRHNTCGKEYKVKINSFNSGRRCPDCTKTKPKSPEEYKREFEKIVNGKCTLLTEYKRATIKIDIHCKKCNSISSVNPSAFLSDSRCPKCEKKTNKK